MSRSILLQIVRSSIEEVFQAERKIDKAALLKEHPLLNENIATTVTIYKDKEIQGSFATSKEENNSLLNNIIISAKKAVFEDTKSEVLTTSDYLHAEIELTLHTENGNMSEIDPPIIKEASTK
jgi:hypothetical protein